MSKDTLALPETRTWREIPQQVRPRAMSSEGRRRVAWGAMRFTMVTLAVALVGWGGWQVASSLRANPALMPEAARGDRVRNLVLVTDGVLDRNWLARRLAIPADATLMGLDLAKLRQTVLADPQVSTAAITRNFPDTLAVHISERSPVVRMMAQSGSEPPAMLLVSRDGVAFAGTGFDASMVSTLPWLQGVRLTRTGGSLAPIEGMRAVSDLLATAKLEADSLYRKWQVVSLARLASDGEIEIHTKDGLTVIFGTTEDNLRQIGRLDLLVDASSDPTRPLREVNLALGAQVPVAYGTAAPTLGGPPVNTLGAEAAKPLIASPLFPNLHIASHSEL
jgi:cell division septal protein FtsQ